MLSKKINDAVILFGDFNQRTIHWTSNGDGTVCVSNTHELSDISCRFLDIISSCELTQHSIHATCNGNQLDLVFTNDLDVHVDIAEKANTSTHDALETCISLNADIKSPPTTHRTVYNYKKADWNAILCALSCICWSSLFMNASVDEAFSLFYDLLFATIKDYIPLVKTKGFKFPSWYTGELISLIRDKEKYHKDFIKNGRNKESHYYVNFSLLRSQIKVMQKELHAEFVINIGNSMKNNPKRFWGYVKSVKASGNLPNVMKYNDLTFSTSQDIANAFNIFFKKVFKPKCFMSAFIRLKNYIFINVPIFKIPLQTPNGIKKKILEMNPHTCSGHDKLSITVLIKCADILCIPLSMLFNMCVLQGVYPNILKRSNVTPIFKQKGTKDVVDNYRGISIEPVISKLFQSIIKDHLSLHVQKLICNEQHGFLPGKSTVSNLICYSDFISKALDNKTQVHSIYTDYSKAFDIVPHGLLMNKLYCQFGFRDNILRLFESFLNNRFQRIVINGVESAWTQVTSGVPQGSILGPLLFIMYINDLPRELSNSKCLLFADDGKFFKIIKSITDCIHLQNDLDAILKWCQLWKLDLNLSKCYVMNFSLKRSRNIVFNYMLGNKTLKYVDEIKDLGVLFTPTLNFENHVNFIVNKAFRMLGFINRVLKDFKDPSVLCTLFNAYVRSRLEYASCVWSPTQQYLSDRIERVQKKFTRVLCYRSNIDYKSFDYIDRCSFFNLQTLSSRRQICDLIYLHKIINNKINCPYLVNEITLYAPTRVMRRKPLFYVKAKLCARKGSYFPRVLLCANSNENIDVFHFTSIYAFKRQIRQYFI